jgi:SAM-dependent methyltransferase
MITQNLPEYWEDLYREKKDEWSLDQVSPPLLDFLEHPSCPKEGRVLVPGAGKGYDAAEWARRGYDTLAVDFSQTAFESMSTLAEQNSKLSAVKLDLFDLTPKSTELFDIVYEYTCFCAVHPGRRDEYFEVWHKMLKPDGIVVACFFPIIEHTSLDGPPHPTSEGELMARLNGVFDVVEQIDVKNSIPERAGKEQIWILKKPESDNDA